ncbi:P-loop containing nucleoside triphosphate hydrolase protein [Dunaliella salina]|uniref:P-loop containing nucleoside triphosphate hydrolase protein n=1 Tax=Dunaliella salina TaxID=3046 RepID=A0ABQ7H1L0_DUNSA|nr:P-loop containing nucleoside triphosphate hydrolase protein [Dunaliella salina]|eukprot:KAF5840720.1 P-loop containing nucleoside triphosphate hydrolase protein [Dunaliella salina]
MDDVPQPGCIQYGEGPMNPCSIKLQLIKREEKQTSTWAVEFPSHVVPTTRKEKSTLGNHQCKDKEIKEKKEKHVGKENSPYIMQETETQHLKESCVPLTVHQGKTQQSTLKLRRYAAHKQQGSNKEGNMADAEEQKNKALGDFREKLLRHKEVEGKVKTLRQSVKELKKEFDKTESDLQALQSVGQIIGEVLRQLDDERFIVKASSGPRYVVGCRSRVDKSKLVTNTRVTLDMTTLTIMRALPREVDPMVFNMVNEDPGKVDYSSIGGLGEQIRELRESIELPLMNPELFLRVGIKPPKGVLLYGPPGTGKTLLAKAIACNIEANFLKVVASAIVDKYIGESARIIREMFGYAKEHQPCVIFMDEIDAIGGRRFSEGTSADREIQRTLMELLSQLDGFDIVGKVKMIMATNRPDVLDPALLRPGRLDRKIEIPLPNENARMEILKIHAQSLSKHGDIDYEAVVKLGENFNGADLRNICTEAGMFAIRDERDYVVQEDFMKAVRKMVEAKKLESSVTYEGFGDKK